jgi:hypothetical protein
MLLLLKSEAACLAGQQWQDRWVVTERRRRVAARAA